MALQKINWTQIDTPNVPTGYTVNIGKINGPINAIYSENIFLSGISISDLYLNDGIFSNGTLILTSNSGNIITISGFDILSGLTVTGILSAATISGGTFYGDGSNLINIDNIYTVDGSLTGNRILDLSGNTLSIKRSPNLNDPFLTFLDDSGKIMFEIRSQNTNFDPTQDDRNIFIGRDSGALNTTGRFNVAFGDGALSGNTTGTSNTAIGWRAGRDHVDGLWNTFIGMNAGVRWQTGNDNTVVGQNNANTRTTGTENTFIGNEVNNGNYVVPILSGNGNTIVGAYTARLMQSDNNVIIGRRAGVNLTTGSRNVFIGRNSGNFVTTDSDLLHIDNVSTTTPLIWGDFANDLLRFNGKVGVNVQPNTFQFDVNGTSRFSNTIQLDTVNSGITDTKILTLSPSNVVQYRNLSDLTGSTVTITGGTNIEITGSYPNFGINYTGQTEFPYLPLSGGTVTGDVIFQSGISVTTISGGTFYGDGSNLTGIQSQNIYNTNGSLNSNRIVDLSSFTLNFSSSTNPNTLVLDNGNVGIGTTNPSAPLHINSTAVPSTNETIFRGTVSDVPGAYIDLRNGSTSDGNFVGQLVGRQVSGSFSSALFIDGFIDVAKDTTSSNGAITFRAARISGSTLSPLSGRTLFDFKNWNSSVMVIDSLGDVGIGTTLPTNKLHVSGSIDPVRFEGLQLSGDTRILTSDNDGVIRYRNFSDFSGSTVTISGGTNIQVTGLYPNFGINFTGTTGVSGDFLPLSGGTVTGDVTIQSGLTANIISATTYLNLPIDIYTTGFTFNTSNYDLTIERNGGLLPLTQNLSILASDLRVTGGTYDVSTGTATFTNNSGGTFQVSGFLTGYTDTVITGFTYYDNKFTINDSGGGTFSATINEVTGLTVNGVLTINPATGQTYSVINFSGDTFIHNYGIGNTFVGTSAGSLNGTGSDNTGFGEFVLNNLDNGDDNTGIGSLALTDLTGGTFNTALGAGSLQNLISGDNNTGVGVGSNAQLLSGSGNTSIGFQTLFNNTDGSDNVAIGNKAGFNGTGSNKLYIANNDSTTLIYGEFDNQKVGINTTSPTNTFHVSGSTDPVRFEGLQLSGDTRILTSDSDGVIRYRNFSDFTGSTVTITGGTNIQITGSYPNFGVNFTGTTGINGSFLPTSGGTVTGNVIFQSGITATTIYATTYQNLPIKYYAEPTAAPTTSPLVLGTDSIAIGSGAEARSNSMFAFGFNAGQNTTGVTNSFFLGFNAGLGANNSESAVYIGNTAGNTQRNSRDSISIGTGAGDVAINTRFSNFIGYYAGQNSTNSNHSNFIGYFAGLGSNDSSYSNFIGYQAGHYGDETLSSKFSNLIGYKAGASSFENIFGIGDNNIIIGTNISLPNFVSNSINIGGVLFGINTYSNSGGTPSVVPTTQGKIGIGVITPLNRLHVEDTSNPLRLVGLQSNSTDNRILSSDSDGVIRYRNFSDFTGSTVTITGGTNIQITGSYPNFGVNYTGQSDFPYLPLSGGTVTGDVSINADLNISNSLHTTAVITANTGSNVVYSIPMGTYTGAFFDYVISNSGNLRAGNVMSVWDGVTSKYTEVSTTDFGDTSPLTFSVGVSGSDAVLSASATTNNWVVKVIIRSI